MVGQLGEDPARQRAHGCRVAARQRDHRPAVPDRLSVREHLVDVDADVRREVGLVHDEQIGSGDAGPALAGDVSPAGDVDEEDLRVDERRREGGGEIVAARLHENDVQRRKVLLQLLDGQQVRRDVVPDGRVRAGTGFDGADSVSVEHAGRPQEARVFVGVDVVGDDAQPQGVSQFRADQGDQRAFSSTYRPTDSDPQGVPLMDVMIRH